MDTLYKKISLLAAGSLFFFQIIAQTPGVGINTSGAAPDGSSMLDVASTTRGFLAPRMTQAQRLAITTPALGLMVYQTDAGTYGAGYYVNGTAGVHDWDKIFLSTSGSGWDLLGNTGTTAGTNFIGTTDAVDLVMKRAGVEKLRLISDGVSVSNGFMNINGPSANSQDLLILDAGGRKAEIKTMGDGSAHLHLRDGTTATMVQLQANGVSFLNGGNVGIGETSPAARLHIKGTNTSAATSSLVVQNSTPTTIFTVNNSGKTDIYDAATGRSAFTFNPDLSSPFFGFSMATTALAPDQHGIIYPSIAFGAPGTPTLTDQSAVTISNTRAEIVALHHSLFVTRQGPETSTATDNTSLLVVGHKTGEGFTPSSGGAMHNAIVINSIINQTGTASGATRGLFINPTLTSAAGWRAIEIASNSGYGIYQSGTSAKNYFNGNVGIGTSNPTYKLHVVQGSDSYVAQFEGISASILNVGKNTLSGESQIHYSNTLSEAWTGIHGSTDAIPGAYVTYTNGSNPIVFQAGVTEKMRITSAGNVGIGTSSPTSKVHIKTGNLIVEDPIDDGTGIRPSFNHIQNGYSLLKIYDKSGSAESYIRNLNASLYIGNPSVEKLISLVYNQVGINQATPKASLDVNGSFALPITSKTADYTITANDYTITGDASGGNITLTLPTAVGIAGVMYVVKKTDASGNSVIIDSNGAETIDGAATLSITTQYTSVVLQSNGSNWYKIN